MRKLSGFMVISVAIILVISLILSGCTPGTTSSSSSSSTSSSEPIKIGVMTSMSGFFTSLSPYMLNGAQMAVDNLNAKGGLLGRQVQIITRDDLGDPSQVPQAASALKSAGVVGIVGTFLDACDSSLFEWSKDNRMIISSCDDDQLNYRTTSYQNNLFFLAPTGTEFGTVFAQSIANQNDVNSVYTLASDVATSHGTYESFWNTMKTLKPSVVNAGSVFVGQTETDLTNNINAALARKPDLVIVLVNGPVWANFVQQGSAFKFFEKTKVATSLNMGAENTVGFGKNYPAGIQAAMTGPFWLDTPEMKAFTNQFYSKYNFYPGELSIDYYVSMLAYTEAIKKAGSTDTDKVIAAYETLTLNTPLGTVSYNDYSHQANVPIWYGTSMISPDYPIAIANNMVKYQDNLYPTKDKILALRVAAK